MKVNFARWEEMKREKLMVKSMYMLKCYSEHEQLKRQLNLNSRQFRESRLKRQAMVSLLR